MKKKQKSTQMKNKRERHAEQLHHHPVNAKWCGGQTLRETMRNGFISYYFAALFCYLLSLGGVSWIIMIFCKKEFSLSHFKHLSTLLLMVTIWKLWDTTLFSLCCFALLSIEETKKKTMKKGATDLIVKYENQHVIVK